MYDLPVIFLSLANVISYKISSSAVKISCLLFALVQMAFLKLSIKGACLCFDSINCFSKIILGL